MENPKKGRHRHGVVGEGDRCSHRWREVAVPRPKDPTRGGGLLGHLYKLTTNPMMFYLKG
ncbi:hypothetical protein Scep_019741 [Stephania cephalantha]|uniref:Uncharacterized protein n=1 Tax=Stephania cephalantha TaxID=152367 RepID=A0AAP0NLN9_9MAGN